LKTLLENTTLRPRLLQPSLISQQDQTTATGERIPVIPPFNLHLIPSIKLNLHEMKAISIRAEAALCSLASDEVFLAHGPFHSFHLSAALSCAFVYSIQKTFFM
jgi:hypothetical protein